MRLDSIERTALKQALIDIEGEVYLFGSRVDNSKRGGDIDLLVFSEKDPFELSREIAIKFFMKCEEKLDVVVMHPKRRSNAEEAFLKMLKLERWQ